MSENAQRRAANLADRERRPEAERAERQRAQADAGGPTSDRRIEPQVPAIAVEVRLAALRQQVANDTGARAQAQSAFEAALIAAAFAARRGELGAVRDGLAARALAGEFAARERSAARALADARQREIALKEEQRLFAEAAASSTAPPAPTARRRTVQAQFASPAAERRAGALAAAAPSLRQLTQRAASRRAGAPPAAGPSIIPAAWLVPTDGRIIRAFGASDGAAGASQGVILRTRARAQVVSPAAGEVSYAGPFRSYGQVLILNLDGGYALVLTGLAAIQARVGDAVRAGQPVGRMAASDTPAPDLYVEVRRNGRAVDPGRWLNGRGPTAAQRVRTG